MLIRMLMLGLMLVTGLSCTNDDPTSPTPTTQEFTIPLSEGTTWVYQYSYSSSQNLVDYYQIHGVRTWQVVSPEVGSLPRTYSLTASTRDTVRHQMITGSGTGLDTTYVIEQSTPFSAILSPDSLVFGWAFMAQVRPGPSADVLQRLPRVVPIGTDTLKLSIGASGAGGVAAYVSGIGLTRYDAVLSAAHSTYVEHIILVSVSVK